MDARDRVTQRRRCLVDLRGSVTGEARMTDGLRDEVAGDNGDA